jgi:hypothetical protein
MAASNNATMRLAFVAKANELCMYTFTTLRVRQYVGSMDDVGDGASGFLISVCCLCATPDPVPCVNQPSAFVTIGVHDDRGRVG